MQVTSWLGAGRAGRHPGVPGVGETLGATKGNSDTQTTTMARPETAAQVKACLDPASLLAASWRYTGTPGDLKESGNLAPTSPGKPVIPDPSHPCLALGLKDSLNLPRPWGFGSHHSDVDGRVYWFPSEADKKHPGVLQ